MTIPIRAPEGDRPKPLSAKQVAELFPEGAQPSERWVRDNVPGKVKVGGLRPFWYEHEVFAWLAGLGGQK